MGACQDSREPVRPLVANVLEQALVFSFIPLIVQQPRGEPELATGKTLVEEARQLFRRTEVALGPPRPAVRTRAAALVVGPGPGEVQGRECVEDLRLPPADKLKSFGLRGAKLDAVMCPAGMPVGVQLGRARAVGFVGQKAAPNFIPTPWAVSPKCFSRAKCACAAGS